MTIGESLPAVQGDIGQKGDARQKELGHEHGRQRYIDIGDDGDVDSNIHNIDGGGNIDIDIGLTVTVTVTLMVTVTLTFDRELETLTDPETVTLKVTLLAERAGARTGGKNRGGKPLELCGTF
jgi:hypothetical protein